MRRGNPLVVIVSLVFALLAVYSSRLAGSSARATTSADLLEKLPGLPVWKAGTIKSASDISKLMYSNSPAMQGRKLNRDTLNTLPAKVVRFNFDKQDYEIYDGQRSPTVDNNQETVGVLLGKVKLSKNDWGTLVLESGFYSLTAIYLYPFNAEGFLGPGLEVADYFGDEGREITISSRISKQAELSKIKSTITFLETPEDEGATKVTKVLKREWLYREGDGFSF